MRLLPLLLLASTSFAQAFDAVHVDSATSACDDFYQHANGAWLGRTPVPAGLQSLGVAELLAERGRLDQRQLLERAAAEPRDALDAALGALWASALVEPDQALAAQPSLQPWFRRIDSLARPRDLVDLIGSAQAAGFPLLFRLDVAVDTGQPDRRIVYALQGGLGLPERDYYLRQESGAVAVREAYQRYVEQVLAAAGDADPATGAVRVMELEVRLARASQSLLQLRDPSTSRRLSRVRELERLYPNLEWRRLLRAQGLDKLDLISLGHIAFFTEANALVTQLPMSHWQSYLRFHLAHPLVPLQDEPLRQAHFALFGRALAGQEQAPQRWEQALQTVQALLGPELDQAWQAQRLDPARLAAAEALLGQLRAALRRRIEVVEWLGQPARDAALAKLDAMRMDIARPSGAKRALPRLEGGNLTGNVLALNALARKDALASIGPAAAAADPLPLLALPWLSYQPERNRLLVSPALLQPPLFDPEGDQAANFGGLGTLLAHELSHGFDAFGAGYDASGKLAPWWGKKEQDAHEARATALMGQYDAYPAVGDLRVDGRLTLAENLADLAGLEIAFEAFASVAAAAPPDAEGRSSAQRFFLAYAQSARRAQRDEVLRLTLASELHAPARWRVNGPLANHPAFAAAFSCPPGKGLVREAHAQLSVWR